MGGCWGRERWPGTPMARLPLGTVEGVGDGKGTEAEEDDDGDDGEEVVVVVEGAEEAEEREVEGKWWAKWGSSWGRIGERGGL